MRRVDGLFSQGVYRSRKGIFLGVCRGLAQYFGLSVFWTRAVTVILLFFTGLWPIAAIYFIAALLMKPEPVVPFSNADQQEFYESYMNSRRGALERLRRRFDNLDTRIQRMENVVTDRAFDWEKRFNA